MARISTHALDIALGRPAARLLVELFRITDSGRERVGSAITNADGRPDQPLLAGDSIETGAYELVFHAGAYFRAAGAALDETLFLDEIPIRFGVAEATGNYHVPLLLAPHGYSTYRGS
jgi:5-hydroxyisourate hydrolase